MTRVWRLISGVGLFVGISASSIAVWNEFTEQKPINNIDDVIIRMDQILEEIKRSNVTVNSAEDAMKISNALSNVSQILVAPNPEVTGPEGQYLRVYSGVFSLKHNNGVDLELPDKSFVYFGFGGFGNTETLLVRLSGQDEYLPGGGEISIGAPELGCSVALLSFKLNSTEGESIANFRYRCKSG